MHERAFLAVGKGVLFREVYILISGVSLSVVLTLFPRCYNEESVPSEIHGSYYTSPAFVSRSLACSLPSDLVVLLSN